MELPEYMQKWKRAEEGLQSLGRGYRFFNFDRKPGTRDSDTSDDESDNAFALTLRMENLFLNDSDEESPVPDTVPQVLEADAASGDVIEDKSTPQASVVSVSMELEMPTRVPSEYKYTKILRTCPSHITNKTGTTGHDMTFSTNFFKLCSNEKFKVYVYKVVFQPPMESVDTRKLLLRGHRKHLGTFIYDGQLLFTPTLLPQPTMLKSMRQSDKTTQSIHIIFMCEMPKDDSTRVRLFCSLIRKLVSPVKLQLFGSNYYEPAKMKTLETFGCHVDLWPGYIVALRAGEADLMLGVELTYKIIQYQTVLDLLKELKTRDHEIILAHVKGLEVVTPYNNRTYLVEDVDMTQCPKTTFTLMDGTKMTYQDYYYERYNLKLRSVDQPLLVSSCRWRGDPKHRLVPISLIPELCRIVGLNHDTRLRQRDFQALADLSSFTVPDHLSKVTNFAQRLSSEGRVDLLNEWNLDLDFKPVQLQGRVLLSERLVWGELDNGDLLTSDIKSTRSDISASTFCGVRGAEYLHKGMVLVTPHSRNITALPVLHPYAYSNPLCNLLHVEDLEKWLVITPEDMSVITSQFLIVLRNMARNLDIRIKKPEVMSLPNDNPATYVDCLREELANHNYQVVICIVPNSREDRYRAIKKLCSCDVNPVPCQVITKKTLENRKERRIARRILIQITTKMGGVPWAVKIPTTGAMVIGISLLRSGGVSYAAVVSSTNGLFTSYHSVTFTYQNTKQLAHKLCEKIDCAIDEYRKCNENAFPKQSVIFRSGFQKKKVESIFEKELEMIKMTFFNKYGGKGAQFAYILVDKHPHVRLFPHGTRLRSGTVVDTCITRPEKYEFYMASMGCFSDKVSSPPVHFDIIWDNTRFTADQLQQLVYKLCHLYFNIADSIRVPAVLHYAERLVKMTATCLKRPIHPELADRLFYL